MKVVILIVFYISSIIADINVGTYNIKWLGYSKTRDNVAISKMLSKGKRDLVVVQEIVAPPYEMIIGDKAIKADPEVTLFFEAMKEEGYDYILSEEDTGTGNKIHMNSARTEWFASFYKKDKLTLIDSGFIAQDRSNNDEYERVPYYNYFIDNKGMDFVVISTHLQPGKSKAKRIRRYQELNSIINFITEVQKNHEENDFIILGDMNVYDCEVLDENLSNDFVRANTECLNSNLKRTEPYDQVLYNKNYTTIQNYQVIDMYETFNIPKDTPNKKVIATYSDHHPIFFTIIRDQKKFNIF